MNTLSIQAEWSKEISQNTDYWYEGNNLPIVLQHEYARLHNLFQNGQIYGSLMQIKDVLELTIKIPTIISIAHMVNGSDVLKQDLYAQKILKQLLSGKLSFGNWLSIKRTMSKAECVLPDFRKIFSDLNKRCDSDNIIKGYVDIAKWRNKRIGHGASGFEESEEFRHEMTALLNILKFHFTESSDIYNCLEFQVLETKNNKLDILNENTQLENYETAEIWLKFNENYFKLNPFIEIIDNRLYLFDTFLNNTREQADFMDYVSAKKLRKSAEEIANLLRNLTEGAGETIEKGTHAIKSLWSKQEELNFLSKDRFDYHIKPKYIFDAVNDFINNNEHGILLLQMMGGMGKTTFVKMLDNLSILNTNDKFYIPGVSVRAYHIHNDYSTNIKVFARELENHFMHDDKNEEFGGEGFHFYNKTTFTDALNYFHNNYAELQSYGYNLNSKMLVIIDGLDEIKSSDINGGIFDFIPNCDDLADGIYLLLTARTEFELSEFAKDHIDNICCTQKIVFDENNENNINLVSTYIDNALQLDGENIRTWLEDNITRRIIRAKILRYIPDAIGKFTVLNTADICKVFMDRLEFSYSTKYFTRVKYILLVLAHSDLPLTIKQICGLLEYNEVDFEILGIFLDIEPLLEREIKDDNIYYRIEQVEYRKFILDNFEKEDEEIAMLFLHRVFVIMEQTNVILSFEDWIAIYFTFSNSRNIVPDAFQDVLNDMLLFKISRAVAININNSFKPESYFTFVLCEIGNALDKTIGMAGYSCDGFLEEFTILQEENGKMVKMYDHRPIEELTYIYVLLMKSVALWRVGMVDALPDLKREINKLQKSSYRDELTNTISKLTVDNINVGDKITTIKETSIYESHIEHDKKSFLFSKLGMAFPVSFHDALGGPREYTLTVLNGMIEYLQKKNETEIDVDMLTKNMLVLNALAKNVFHYENGVVNAHNAPDVRSMWFKYVSYDFILNAFAKALNFSYIAKKKLAHLFNNKSNSSELSVCERNCITSCAYSFLMQNRKEGFDDDYFNLQIDFTTSEIYVNKSKTIQNIVGYRNQFDALYHLINSKFLFDNQGVLGFLTHKVFYSHNGLVLGFDKAFSPAEKVEYQEHNGMFFSPSGWKVHTYDYNLRYLCQIRALSEDTISAMRLLVDNKASYYDYDVIRQNNGLSKIKVREKTLELFDKKIVDSYSITDIFTCFDSEYFQLGKFVPEQFNNINNIDDIYNILLQTKFLAKQHKTALIEYRDIKSIFFNTKNTDQAIVKLKLVMFDLKLITMTDALISEQKRIYHLKKYQEYILKGETLPNFTTYPQISFMDLEEIVKMSKKGE